MPRTKKDFEAARLGVFATPGSLLIHLSCGIRIKENLSVPSKIWVTVKPQASRESVTKLSDGSYRVTCHAAPRDGEANEAVIKLLAQYLRVPKSAIKIIRGSSGRKKLIEVA